MDSTALSVQAGFLGALTGEATSRKRKQTCDVDSVPAPRRIGRLRYQESGSSSSMVTTLAGAQRDSLTFRRLYQAEDSSVACGSAHVGSNGAKPAELLSVPSVDTCEDVGAQTKKPSEGRVFDPFRPFSSRSPSKNQSPAIGLGQRPSSTQTVDASAETALVDRQSCESRGYNRNITPWEKGDWPSEQDLRLRADSHEPGSESVGGRSTGTGTSGVTKLGNSTSGSGSGLYRQEIIRGSPSRFEGEGKRRLSQEWNSASGSQSGITKDRGVWRNTSVEEPDDGDAQSGGGLEGASPATSAEDAAPLTLPEASPIPALQVPAVAPGVGLQGKRGRKELGEGEERQVKVIRRETPKKVVRSNGCAGDNPDSETSSGHGQNLRRELQGAVGNKKDTASLKATSLNHPGMPAPVDLAPRTVVQADNHRVTEVSGQNAVAAQVAVVDKAWEMRDGNSAHLFVTSTRERMSDSHTDLLDVESSGRLSGYDPDTSLSDAPDGAGSLFVLSSGRTRRRQGVSGASRRPTIDDEFEQYFSQMLL